MIRGYDRAERAGSRVYPGIVADAAGLPVNDGTDTRAPSGTSGNRYGHAFAAHPDAPAYAHEYHRAGGESIHPHAKAHGTSGNADADGHIHPNTY